MPPKDRLFTDQMEKCIASGVWSICHFSMPVTADSHKHAGPVWSRWVRGKQLCLWLQSKLCRHVCWIPSFHSCDALHAQSLSSSRVTTETENRSCGHWNWGQMNWGLNRYTSLTMSVHVGTVRRKRSSGGGFCLGFGCCHLNSHLIVSLLFLIFCRNNRICIYNKHLI